jgi:type III pantothenate kinase
MLLTIDVGNTNITLGAYLDDELQFVSRLATDRERTRDQYAIELHNLFELHKINTEAFEGAVISSVMPELNSEISRAVSLIINKKPLMLAPGIKTGVNILTDNPAQVGADLIAGAVGAVNLYPLPCIIADLGTATKVSIIDENGSFLGCTIAPGVAISLEALSSRTSQLPRISFDSPSHSIGKNTIESMQAGVVFGTAAMIDGICDKMEQELGRKVKTFIATGGLSKDIVKNCRHEMIYNRELLLYGLKIIYKKNLKAY